MLLFWHIVQYDFPKKHDTVRSHTSGQVSSPDDDSELSNQVCARFDNMETVSDDRSTIDRGIYGVNRLRISFYIDRTNY